VGLIEEEVERVVPEVVVYGGDSGTATGVNYASLVGVLVKAVKEQKRERNSLAVTVEGQQKEPGRLKREQKGRDSLVANVKEQQTELASLKAEVGYLRRS
jgi:hypothetical protein